MLGSREVYFVNYKRSKTMFNRSVNREIMILVRPRILETEEIRSGTLEEEPARGKRKNSSPPR